MIHLSKNNYIFVFTGPDGSGRNTIADLVAKTTLNMKKLISYTTREKRPFEHDGEDYHFVSVEVFQKMMNNGDFLEVVENDGIFYGISEEQVNQAFHEKESVYVVVNDKGASFLKSLYPENVIRLFIYADRDTVLNRQKERGDDDATIERHMSHFDELMSYKSKCEYSFENYDLSHTLFEVTNKLEEYLNKQ